MKKLFAILFILLFSFCSKEKHQYPRLIVPDVDDVVEVNTRHMLQSSPVLLGINFTKDTSIIMHKERNLNKSIIDLKKDTLLPRYDLKIIIDTTYDFHYNEFEYKWHDLAKFADSITKLNFSRKQFEDIVFSKYYGKINRLRKNHVVSYTLLIYNNGKENAYLEEVGVNNFSLIQEAKDTDGNWKPIEYIYSLPLDIIDYSCTVLSPKKYLATSIIKYHGDFKTKLRVKIRFGRNYYYSNEIEGYINKSQFYDGFLNTQFFKIEPYYDDAWTKRRKEGCLLKHKF